MKQIGLIADTHNFLDEAVFHHFADCDEVWHAGDFGTIAIADQLGQCKKIAAQKTPIRGVYGNIDGYDIRSVYPERLIFTCEDVKVLMQHIGGYPGRYAPGIKDIIRKEKPQLFISGHSHILKIMYDEQLQCLHMNPGAAGKQGWHKVRTLIRFVIDGKQMRDCQVIELGKR